MSIAFAQALATAVSINDVNFVEKALKNGFPINSVLPIVDSPLLTLAALVYQRPDIVTLLLSLNVDCNQISEGLTPLIGACNLGNGEIVRLLLNNPWNNTADPNQVCENSTPLMAAASKGHHEIVKMLLDDPRQNSADPNWAGRDGFTALMNASQHGHTQVVELLLKDPRNGKCADPCIPAARKGYTALLLAAQDGHTAVASLLLADSRVNPNQSAKDGSTALYVAAQNGHYKMVTLLMDDPRVDPNIPNQNGDTPLFVSASAQHLDIYRFLFPLTGNGNPAVALLHCPDNRYLIKEDQELGKGSFGRVVKAFDRANTNRLVAAKILSSGGGRNKQRELVEKEALALWTKDLRHENIIEPLFGLTWRDPPALIMEFAPGGSVRSQIKHFRLHESLVRRYLLHAFEGLSYLHSHNVLHCDIKPDNMLIGEGDVLKLADFGISYSSPTGGDSPKGTPPGLFGTPHYMSYDLYDSQPPSSHSDLWALGCAVVEMAIGPHRFGPWAEVITYEDIKTAGHIGPAVKAALKESKRPKIPPILSDELQTLITEMFDIGSMNGNTGQNLSGPVSQAPQRIQALLERCQLLCPSPDYVDNAVVGVLDDGMESLEEYEDKKQQQLQRNLERLQEQQCGETADSLRILDQTTRYSSGENTGAGGGLDNSKVDDGMECLEEYGDKKQQQLQRLQDQQCGETDDSVSFRSSRIFFSM